MILLRILLLDRALSCPLISRFAVGRLVGPVLRVRPLEFLGRTGAPPDYDLERLPFEAVSNLGLPADAAADVLLGRLPRAARELLSVDEPARDLVAYRQQVHA